VCENLFEMLERKAFYLMSVEFIGIKRGKWKGMVGLNSLHKREGLKSY
jgi:hypothetical protein